MCYYFLELCLATGVSLDYRFRLISILLTITTIVMVVLYYMNERSYHNSFEQRYGSMSSKALKSAAPTPTPSPSPATGGALAPPVPTQSAPQIDRAKSDELRGKWQEMKQMLQSSARKCESALARILPDNSLIDVDDPFYDNPDAVVAKYVDILQEGLLIDQAMEATSIFNESVLNVTEMNFLELKQMEEAFDICRSQRALVFIETVFEAFTKKMWAPVKRGPLMQQTLGYLQYRLELYPSTAQNITFSLNLLLGLSVQGLLPKELQADLDDLYEKVIESQELSRELPKMDRTPSVKRELYRENYANNRYIAGELLELVKRMGSAY